MTRPLSRLLVGVPLTGILVASLSTGAWLALGQPTPASATTWFQVQGVPGDANYTGAPTEPFFFLALGNDDRSAANDGNGDAVHVIGVNPAAKQATILDIPRDTEGPDFNKITNAHATGGLPRTIDYLNRMLGVKIRYAVTVSFPGFIAMVDSIGGVPMSITERIDDADSGAHFSPGQLTFNGEQALAFTRNRKGYPVAGDRQRTVNQGLIILAALSKLRATNPGPAGTLKLVATLGRHVEMENVSVTDLTHLMRLALTLDPAAIKNVLLPTVAGRSEANLAVSPDAAGLIADFADDGILQTH